MKPFEKRSYDFFRLHGYTMSNAIDAANIEFRAEERNIAVDWETDDLPWDGDDDCQEPKYLLCGVVRRSDSDEIINCLGRVGVDSMNDPYLRMEAVDILYESLYILDHEDEIAAKQYAERPTFAMVG